MSDAPLWSAALSVALVHTVVGIDHYLPFVVLARARRWSIRKVALVTSLCGVGHVLGSLALGAVGIALGVAVGRLEWVESFRGVVAAWGLVVFGLLYVAWAMTRLARDARHTHVHAHDDGSMHVHEHDHRAQHLHPHEVSALTFWGLFIVFALGPCEPLIPLLMVPAFQQDAWLVVEVALLFSVTTIATMVAMAVLGSLGLAFVPLLRAERYAHVLAGAAIVASGVAIRVAGV